MPARLCRPTTSGRTAYGHIHHAETRLTFKCTSSYVFHKVICSTVCSSVAVLALELQRQVLACQE